MSRARPFDLTLIRHSKYDPGGSTGRSDGKLASKCHPVSAGKGLLREIAKTDYRTSPRFSIAWIEANVTPENIARLGRGA